MWGCIFLNLCLCFRSCITAVVVDPRLHACLEVSFHTLKRRGIHSGSLTRIVSGLFHLELWLYCLSLKMKGPFGDNCLRYFYLWLAFLAGCVESIRRALVLGLVLIAGITIEQALSVCPHLLQLTYIELSVNTVCS